MLCSCKFNILYLPIGLYFSKNRWPFISLVVFFFASKSIFFRCKYSNTSFLLALLSKIICGNILRFRMKVDFCRDLHSARYLVALQVWVYFKLNSLLEVFWSKWVMWVQAAISLPNEIVFTTSQGRCLPLHSVPKLLSSKSPLTCV